METVATRAIDPAAPARLAADAPRAVLAAARDAAASARPATLAVVVDTEGSTYVRPGAVALFEGDDAPAGWLSGGCLEPEIARHAAACADTGALGWLDLDTRDDEDLLSGSTPGCRGRLRLALLPLRALPGIDAVFAGWLGGGRALAMRITGDGRIETLLDSRIARVAGRRGMEVGRTSGEGDVSVQGWTLPAPSPSHAGASPVRRVHWAPPPELLLFGAGPETATLLPALRALGWRTTLVERRPRWRGLATLADAHVDATPTAAVAADERADAALVMHHHFELDREALHALAGAPIAYVGLLGPVRRREDLFRVLPASARPALAARLRSPVGLHLGGQGAAAVSLSIVAQLQAWRHGLEPAR